MNYAVTAEQLAKALAAWIGGMGLSPLAFAGLVMWLPRISVRCADRHEPVMDRP